MSESNITQKEYWNGPHGRRWADFREIFEARFASHIPPLMDKVAARAGDHVVDIGCGFGPSTVRVAQQVGPTGSVIGLDISRVLLDQAERLAGQSLGEDYDVQFIEADAQTYPFKKGWADIVCSRFGVMFFADPVAAFKNIRTVLKDGGRLAFICWAPPQENQWMTAPTKAAQKHLNLPPPPPPGSPGIFAFADRDRIDQILSDAGFSDISIEKVTPNVTVGTNLDDAVSDALAVAPWASALDGQAEATVAALMAEIRATFEPYETPQGVVIQSACWLVGARS